MAESFEYAVRKDVKNNPIVREVDEERQLELSKTLGLAALVVVSVMFWTWQHFDLLRHGYRLEELQRAQAEEESATRLLRLQIETLRSPKRIEALALRAALLVSQAASESAASRDASLSSINAALREGYEALPERLEVSPVHARVFSSAKVSRVSFALSRLQLSGYYFPWTGEAQINGEMPVSLWPRVAAHELAHQRGFARENEATVVGLLACLASKDPFVRYGGSLGLFASFDRELRRLDPSAREAVWARLPRVAVEDFEREAAFWKRFDGPAATVSEKVNDRYLKTQGVRSGVQSYGETTRLLLQAAATPGIRIPWPVVQSP